MRKYKPRWLALIAIHLTQCIWVSQAIAGPREQCYRLHNRLIGVPPTTEALEACTANIAAGRSDEAALQITQNEFFLSDTLRAVFTPWTTKTGEMLLPLNDFIATGIGLARDDQDFRLLLTGDIVYTCEGQEGLPAFALNNNSHYEGCSNNVPLDTALTPKKQSELDPRLAGKESVPAGMLTTRGFAATYYLAGTNRAATRMLLLNFLCEDINAFHDTSISDYRVRQDIERVPGGSTKTYVNECKGCHAGMDPLTGAFAHADFENGMLVYDESKIAAKFFRAANTFPDGYRTVDDSWLNLWNSNSNARVNWGSAAGTVMSGQGMRSLGEMFANSEQFSQCMARHAVKRTCLTEADLKSPRIKTLAQAFQNSGYKIKSLFAQAALGCMGE